MPYRISVFVGEVCHQKLQVVHAVARHVNNPHPLYVMCVLLDVPPIFQQVCSAACQAKYSAVTRDQFSPSPHVSPTRPFCALAVATITPMHNAKTIAIRLIPVLLVVVKLIGRDHKPGYVLSDAKFRRTELVSCDLEPLDEDSDAITVSVPHLS